jgi:hypothetical protein
LAYGSDLPRAGSLHRLPGLPGDSMDGIGEEGCCGQRDFDDGCELVPRTTRISHCEASGADLIWAATFHRLYRRSEPF